VFVQHVVGNEPRLLIHWIKQMVKSEHSNAPACLAAPPLHSCLRTSSIVSLLETRRHPYTWLSSTLFLRDINRCRIILRSSEIFKRSRFSHYSRPATPPKCRSPRRRRVALSFAKHSALRSSSPNICMRPMRYEQAGQILQIRAPTLTCTRSIATSSSAFCATSVLTPSSLQLKTERLLHCPVTSKKTTSRSDGFPLSIQAT
jgi:hypothetical protein